MSEIGDFRKRTELCVGQKLKYFGVDINNRCSGFGWNDADRKNPHSGSL